MSPRALGAGIALALAVALAATPAAAAPLAAPGTPETGERRVIATSTQGVPVIARQFGASDAPVQLVVIGQMHGSEPGGRAVVRELRERPLPEGVGVWLITSMNPDGHRTGSRVNARGVDLNRNFPASWAATPRSGPFWSGPRPASEPEVRGIMRFLSRERPTAVLSFHQAYDVVDITHRRARAAGRKLAGWMGEQARVVGCGGPCRGTMTEWIDRSLGTIALTVELDSSVSAREADVAAAAVLRLGRWLGR